MLNSIPAFKPLVSNVPFNELVKLRTSVKSLAGMS
jgi:hypothetical protein